MSGKFVYFGSWSVQFDHVGHIIHSLFCIVSFLTIGLLTDPWLFGTKNINQNKITKSLLKIPTNPGLPL